MDAYQIVDFDNPISVKHFEYSVRSLEPVSDLLNVKQVQCVTPSTLPVGLLSEEKDRSPTEKAALLSHYYLIKRIAEGEKLIILEHDVYLRPGFEDIFRKAFETYRSLPVWVPGIAVECYTISQAVAKRFCKLVESDRNHKMKGPMLLLHVAGDRECPAEGVNTMWPLSSRVDGRYNMSCLASCPQNGLDGKGVIVDAAITQHVYSTLGSTIKHNKKSIEPESSPNIFFH